MELSVFLNCFKNIHHDKLISEQKRCGFGTDNERMYDGVENGFP